jgi:hypothetical protein
MAAARGHQYEAIDHGETLDVKTSQQLSRATERAAGPPPLTGPEVRHLARTAGCAAARQVAVDANDEALATLLHTGAAKVGFPMCPLSSAILRELQSLLDARWVYETVGEKRSDEEILVCLDSYSAAAALPFAGGELRQAGSAESGSRLVKQTIAEQEEAAFPFSTVLVRWPRPRRACLPAAQLCHPAELS